MRTFVIEFFDRHGAAIRRIVAQVTTRGQAFAIARMNMASGVDRYEIEEI